jgi:hypothetical protein
MLETNLYIKVARFTKDDFCNFLTSFKVWITNLFGGDSNREFWIAFTGMALLFLVRKKEILQKESVKYKYYATFICGLELFLVFTSSGFWSLRSSSNEVMILEGGYINIRFTCV